MNFYPFNIGDYAGSTRHLTWDEDMAYRRMLDAYYSREAPLPPDRKAIYRLVAATDKRHKAAVDMVLDEFFEQHPDGWHNLRCDEELAKMAEKALDGADRRDNEKERQRRHRARKKELFALLRERGVVPAYDTPIAKLEELLQRSGNGVVTPNVTPVTLPVTPDATANTITNPNPNPHPPLTPPPGVTASVDEFERADAALRQVPGISNHPVFADPSIAPIWALIQRGYDLRTQILPSVQRQAKRKQPIRAWSFFQPGIIEDVKRFSGEDLPAAVTDATWEGRLATARKMRQWDVKNWGAAPGEAGCRVPAHLLQPSDGKGWTEWRAAS